jgi:hypothetical protein
VSERECDQYDPEPSKRASACACAWAWAQAAARAACPRCLGRRIKKYLIRFEIFWYYVAFGCGRIQKRINTYQRLSF